MMPADVESRLRQHARSVVASAHLAARERDEIAEEVYGHLVERWRAGMARGDEAHRAATRAIDEFGSARDIGRAFTSAYRGWLFASTVGALVPPARSAPAAMSIGRAVLALGVYIMAVDTAFAALDAIDARTPVRAVVVGAAWVVAASILGMTGVALQRGQRWALGVTIAVTAMAAGHASVAFWMTPGSVSVTGVGAGVALVSAWLDRDRLRRSATEGPRSRTLVASMTAALVACFATAPVMSALEDPTQASQEQLDLTVTVTCDRTVSDLDDEVLRWTVDVTWEWAHVGVLPGGLREWHDHADTLVLRHPGDEWTLVATRPPHLASGTGRTVGWHGTGQPSDAGIAPDLGPAVVEFAMRAEDTHAGIRYQAAWIMHSRRTAGGWPAIAEAWYFHGDEWSLVATAGCGERDHGAPARP